MKQLIFAIGFLFFYAQANAQTPAKKVIHLTKLSEIKTKLPKGTYLKDSSVLLSKGYYYKFSDDTTKVTIMQRAAGGAGIITGSFACGGCSTPGVASCRLDGTNNTLKCVGCLFSCRLIVEKGGSSYSLSGVNLRL